MPYYKYRPGVPEELGKLHPSALPKTYSFTNAVGAAKAHPYLPVGRDLAGPDHRNRHGPRKLAEFQFEGAWRGSGSLGRPPTGNSVITEVPVVRGRELKDPKFCGVQDAEKMAQRIAAGTHRSRGYLPEPANPFAIQNPNAPLKKKKIKVNYKHTHSHITFR